MTSPFMDPPQSSGFQPSGRIGDLVIMQVRRLEQAQGQAGVRPAMRANVVTVQSPTDPERDGEGFADVLIMGVILVDQLSEVMAAKGPGGMMAGRLAQKVGRSPNPAVKLDEPTPQDRQLLEAFVARGLPALLTGGAYQAGAPQAPQPPPQPPAPVFQPQPQGQPQPQAPGGWAPQPAPGYPPAAPPPYGQPAQPGQDPNQPPF